MKRQRRPTAKTKKRNLGSLERRPRIHDRVISYFLTHGLLRSHTLYRGRSIRETGAVPVLLLRNATLRGITPRLGTIQYEALQPGMLLFLSASHLARSVPLHSCCALVQTVQEVHATHPVPLRRIFGVRGYL